MDPRGIEAPAGVNVLDRHVQAGESLALVIGLNRRTDSRARSG